jgi:FdhE protein
MREQALPGSSFVGHRTSDFLFADASWKKWTDLVEMAVAESHHAYWADRVLVPESRQLDAPLIHGARVHVPVQEAAAFVAALVREFGIVAVEGADPVALIRVGIERDESATESLARTLAIPVDTCALVGQLSALPLLFNGARLLSADAAKTWQRGYCPVCGAWPSLAELRGIQRERRLRCGCCASDWLFPVLRCAFCDEVDHRKLGYFSSDGEEHLVRVETCTTCRGYLKSVTTLGALPLPSLAMKDLSTVTFDLAAVDREYARPSHPGWRVSAEITS